MEKCPHLNCLVYHKNGVCNCDMARYCHHCQTEIEELEQIEEIYINEPYYEINRHIDFDTSKTITPVELTIIKKLNEVIERLNKLT